MRDKYETNGIFILNKNGGIPLFIKLYKNAINIDTYLLTGWFVSLHVFSTLVYQSHLVDEELNVHYLGFQGKSNTKYEFVYSMDDMITTVLVITYKDNVERTRDKISQQLVTLTDEFKRIFSKEIQEQNRQIDVYMEKFSSVCDSIIFKK